MSKVSKVLKNLRYTNKPLLLFSLILFIFGLIMVFSASNISAFMRYGTDPYHYVITQGKYLLMGLALFLVVINIDSKQYIGLCWLGLLLGAGLLIGAFLLNSLGFSEGSSLAIFSYRSVRSSIWILFALALFCIW